MTNYTIGLGASLFFISVLSRVDRLAHFGFSLVVLGILFPVVAKQREKYAQFLQERFPCQNLFESSLLQIGKRAVFSDQKLLNHPEEAQKLFEMTLALKRIIQNLPKPELRPLENLPNPIPFDGVEDLNEQIIKRRQEFRKSLDFNQLAVERLELYFFRVKASLYFRQKSLIINALNK